MRTKETIINTAIIQYSLEDNTTPLPLPAPPIPNQYITSNYYCVYNYDYCVLLLLRLGILDIIDVTDYIIAMIAIIIIVCIAIIIVCTAIIIIVFIAIIILIIDIRIFVLLFFLC